MQNPQISQCSNCGSLREIYKEIECTLIDLIKRKWANAQYNTALSFNQSLYDDLVRYKRVVYKRMFNPAYPCVSVDVQDIITQVRLRVYKPGTCSMCADCFPPGTEDTTTSTSSTSTTTLS